jgi:hypothetical protein
MEKIDAASGVVFEKDANTNKRYVRIDFDRHREALVPFLERIGVIDANDDFWKEYAASVTGDELRQRIYQRIDAWQWNEK